ncbi:hypothetical protein E2P47_03195, partial [Candidatus Bathyarchaeota archaeon]
MPVIFLLALKVYKQKNFEEILELDTPEIEQSHKELLSIWDKDRYLEKRVILQWIKKHSNLQPFLRDLEKSKISNLDLRDKVGWLFSVFDKPEEMIAERNEIFIQQEMLEYKDLFDTVEEYPLTQNQKRSIITDEFFNLVIAGAGTGKTSTIVGKTAYILEKGLAKPNEVLLLSFALDSKQELFNRIKARLN